MAERRSQVRKGKGEERTRKTIARISCINSLDSPLRKKTMNSDSFLAHFSFIFFSSVFVTFLSSSRIRHRSFHPAGIGHWVLQQPGRNHMVWLLSARFHRKNLAQRVAKYLKNRSVCCKLARHTRPPALLRPLPVPDSPWRDLSVDFVRPLPTSDGFNMIMVIVARLTKMRH